MVLTHADLFSSGTQSLDTAVRTLLVYVLALALVRLAGRRTLAQLSAFDVLVTIAAGTVVGSAALPSKPAVSDGVVVLVTLFLLQVLLAALRQRSAVARRVLDFQPRTVVRSGRFEPGRAPSTAQLTDADLAALLRRHGVSDLPQVRLAVLEPTGKLSVLREDQGAGPLFPEQ